MDINSMINQIEEYYGTYENAKVKSMVIAYLQKDHKETMYKDILKAILYFHIASFKAPCIASIESCIKSSRLEKGQVDTHKTKATNTSQYDYRSSLDPAFDKVDVDLKEMLRDKIKKV